MQVVVYVLRRNGEKLPPNVVQSRPVPGWLYFGRDTRKIYPGEAVRLFKSASEPIDMLEPLTNARLKSIDRGGMMFVGTEEVRSSATQRQAWWCLPGPLDDLTGPG